MKEVSERKIVEDILSHNYMYQGNCINCGKEFVKFSNKKAVSISSSCCSDKCAKKVNQENRRRKKEIHHYEVFKDSRYYYIKNDDLFIEKRTFKGKTWRLEEIKHILDSSPILSPDERIPKKAVKIIDRTSPFLYDDQHPFKMWKDLKPLSEVRI